MLQSSVVFELHWNLIKPGPQRPKVVKLSKAGGSVNQCCTCVQLCSCEMIGSLIIINHNQQDRFAGLASHCVPMADGSSGASKGSPKESHSNLARFIPLPQGSKFWMFTPVFGTCNFDAQAIFEKPENKKKLKQAATRMQKTHRSCIENCLYTGHGGLQEWSWLTPDERYRNTTETRWSTPQRKPKCVRQRLAVRTVPKESQPCCTLAASKADSRLVGIM